MGESKPTHSEACCEYCGRPLAPCVVEFGARRIVAGFRECDCEGARGQRARAERMEAAKREARLAERRKRAGIPKRFLGATVQHQDLIDYLSLMLTQYRADGTRCPNVEAGDRIPS